MALRLVPCVRSPQGGQHGQRQGVALLASVHSGNSAFRWDEQLYRELHTPTQSLRAPLPSARATANPAGQHLPLPLLLRSKTWPMGRPSSTSHPAQASPGPVLARGKGEQCDPPLHPQDRCRAPAAAARRSPAHKIPVAAAKSTASQ